MSAEAFCCLLEAVVRLVVGCRSRLYIGHHVSCLQPTRTGSGPGWLDGVREMLYIATEDNQSLAVLCTRSANPLVICACSHTYLAAHVSTYLGRVSGNAAQSSWAGDAGDVHACCRAMIDLSHFEYLLVFCCCLTRRYEGHVVRNYSYVPEFLRRLNQSRSTFPPPHHQQPLNRTVARVSSSRN